MSREQNHRGIVIFASALLFGLLLPRPGEPGPASRLAAELAEKGDRAWADRGNPKSLYHAIAFYEEAAKLAGDRADLWVKLAEAYYWLGETTEPGRKKERVKAYEQCQAAAEKGMKIDIKNPGANLWATVCNGRKTEVVGLLSGAYDLGLAIICLGRVARYDNDYYYGAIYRYWGRFIYEIPELGRKLVHFSLDDSRILLQEGIKIEPNFFLTRLYLADTYLAMGERELAKKELLYIVNTDPAVLPEAEPENRFYQAQAREKLEKEFPEAANGKNNPAKE